MRKQSLPVLAFSALLGALAPVSASAHPPLPQAAAAEQGAPSQAPPASAPQAAPSKDAPALPPGALTVTRCGTALLPPATTPPAGSTFLWQVELCFNRQGGASSVESETYMYWVKLRGSQPSQNIWVPWDEKAEQMALADFQTLMRNTNFLEDMRIEVDDFTFPNGAVGKIVTYDMEERERVKIVDYRGEEVDRAKIDEQLRERGIELRLDSFLDEGTVRRIKTVVREIMAEKGFSNATVTHTVTPVAGGPKLVNVTFNVDKGPKIKIRRIDFIGNQAIGDGTLQRKMKENKPKGILSWITGGGTYKEAEFEEDAAKVVDHYRNKGYAQARVGQPEIKVLEDTKDGDTRWVELRIPVTEGKRYRVGELTFEGNKLVQSDGLRSLYKIEKGDWFSAKKLEDGRKKVTEIYGGAGYMELTAFPMPKFSDEPDATEAALAAQVPAALAAPPAPVATNGNGKGRESDPTIDLTIQIEEGPQYFVNRIIFTGNTTTRDNVIRRELRLVEGGVFNTEALKYSVRRLNQLGYFKQLEGNEKDLDVKKTEGRQNAVDVTIKFEEQNRNQLTFGAGVSQYEGFFGQLAFQTSNFMGRGESLTLSMTAGDRSQNYQLAFTEPFLFDRNITGGFDIYKRALQYIGYYTQKSTGGNLVFGFPVADFSRMFINYAYETVKMTDLSEALIDTSCILRAEGCSIISSVSDLTQLTETQREVLSRNPFVFDSLLIGQGGRRTISKLMPTFVHNTVDNPIFPNTGKRLTATIDLAMLGGNTQFYKPRLEGIFFFRHTARTSVGFRGAFEYISPVGNTTSLPIFERLYLGGEYSIRGFDIRSVGPTVPNSQIVLGGNKSLLFNAEYMFSIMSQARIVLFYDAGQVRDFGQKFGWHEDVTQIVQPPLPSLVDPFATTALLDPSAPGPQTLVTGRTSAFKTSTGVELRFFMPVLNVPFRLIYSWNPQRVGVLDNNFRPAKETTFRFAVGTTF
jgi:outer membrane protein insertion porin family